MSNIVIITGGSKGIGKALAEKYAQEHYKVFSLARSIADVDKATQIPVDLSNLSETTKAFTMLLDSLENEDISSLTLINNAGRLGTIANLENISTEDIAMTIQLNTTTPLVLSSMFIEFSKNVSCKKSIINISSGAGVNAYAGWSVYCNSKASIDMLTKSIHEEQKELKNGVQSYGIRPGVVDTNMQTQIRSTDEENFKLKQRFVDLKDNNQLYTTQFVAKTIFNFVTKSKLISGKTIDIRELV